MVIKMVELDYNFWKGSFSSKCFIVVYLNFFCLYDNVNILLLFWNILLIGNKGFCEGVNR